MLLAAFLVVVAAVAAALLGRRRPDAPTQNRVQIPRQLDRNDFPHAAAPWLLVVFSSKTCESCQRVSEQAERLQSDQVAYCDISWQVRRDLHERYGVNDVPLVLIADHDGVVQRSFVGVPNPDDLVAALAEARRPGSTSRPGAGRLHLDEPTDG